MKHIAILCCALALALALGWARPAVAETSEDARAQAKAAFGDGQRAFEAKDYAQALTHFRRAFELHHHDAVRFNIAVCLQKMERHREALLEYEAAAKSDQLDEAARDRARDLATAARLELGTLAVSGSPAGADVLVDGVEICNLPCTVSVDPTRHEVEVRSGGKSERRSVVVAKQEARRINVELGGTSAKAPVPEAAPLAPSVEPVHDAPKAASGGGPGWLTWTGAGLVVLGGAGAAIFGSQAKSNHDDWVETGNPSAKDDGVRARNLTNASIGVAVLGAVAIGVDLLVLGPKRAKKEAAGFRGVRFHF
jgi:hypothetical protein